jgi:hypothetical protein
MKEAADKNNLLSFIKPMPSHQPDLTKPNVFYAQGPLGSDTEKMYGKENCWYDWSINNWGTKWEADVFAVTLSDGLLAISFDTAWSPSVTATSFLIDKGYRFKHLYFESGMNFYGEFTPDHEFTSDIDFDPININNEHALTTALIDMCHRHGIDDDIIDHFNMVDCYYNPDYEPSDKNKSDDDILEGA